MSPPTCYGVRMKNKTTTPKHHQTAATPLLELEALRINLVQVHLLDALGELTQLRKTMRHGRRFGHRLALLLAMVDNASRLLRSPLSGSSDAGSTLFDIVKKPALNTWWVRDCNQKRYCLRQIHAFNGEPYVWIYEEGANRCHHLPFITLLKRYRQLDASPVSPAADTNRFHLN